MKKKPKAGTNTKHGIIITDVPDTEKHQVLVLGIQVNKGRFAGHALGHFQILKKMAKHCCAKYPINL